MNQTVEAFKRVIQSGNFVVLDTETTGLYQGEIVQIAIVDASGKTLLDTLVRPINPIPSDATAIHGITDQMVQSAPTWGDIWLDVSMTLAGRNVVVYNAVYDRKMMHQAAEAAGLPKFEWKEHARWWCAMEAFAVVYGDWNDYRQSYRWQKLTTAARYYNLPVTNAHSALGDCLMTLGVCKGMILPVVSQ